ncbi:MAG TPA: PQQ-dependent sugar dehydrogenase [Planctomycetota bacterium]|nr:PQQ-dependent sugar dehydrogenase [Planctomycetota bacterium]
MRNRLWIVIALLMVGAPAGFAGTPQDVNFAESTYALGMSQITGISWTPDGSNTMFVSQKTGALRVIRSGSLQAANFATLSVFTDSECGLDDVLVDPSYASNKFVYVFATVSNATQQILRFTAAVDGSGNLVGQNRVQIGPNLPTRGVNHDGGGLAIGSDGLLYFGVGNNGNGNNVGGNGTSGEFTSLGSKIGRMDRMTGQPATTNPYYNASDGITDADYIFARGMRNPFGLRFSPFTGALWLTEVGDGWEQIFVVPRDGNAGWPTENNTSTTNGLLIPKLAYQTNVSTFGGCITRGVFYNGSMFPSQYAGNLFFVDYNSGKVMRSVLDGGGNNINSTSVFVTGNSSLVDIAVGPDGALYYASNGGTIYRLAYTGSGPQNILASATTLSVNEASNASFTAHLAVAPPSNVTVSVSRSSGSAGVTASPASLTFTPSNWNMAQTVTVSAAEDTNNIDEGATISLASSGLTTQNVVVTARDNDRPSGSPTATITQPKNGATVSGTNADFYGDGSDPQGNATLARAEFTVDNVLQYTDPYNPAVGHFHYGGDHLRWDTTGIPDGPHKVRMTVVDTGGLSGSHEVDIVVSNGSGGGLSGEYYDNIDFTTLKLARTDSTVNFDWGSGSPDPSIGADTFSVRWTGQVQANATETVTFYTTTDDGVRLWIDNVLIIDHFVDQGPTEWSGSIALQGGQRYDVRMDYFENGGGATAKLSWSSPSTPKQVLPQNRLFSLPAPWRSATVGTVGVPGSAGIAGGTSTVKGSGADIWGTMDAFHFLYRPLAGDGTLTARVSSVQNTDVWAKAGVMVRDALAPDSRHAFMAITPGNGAAFQRRTAMGGASTTTAGPAVVAPYWVRLVRSGNTLTGSVSNDGSAWTTLGSDTIPMGALVNAGLAVTSHNNSALCTATFTNVSVTGGAFQQDPGADGLLVMEAEDFHGNVAQGGHTWDATSPSGYSGSGARVANPNSGVNNDTGYTTNSPRLDYRVYFSKAGTHQVWVRGMAATGSDDSCHIGLDGAAVTSSDRLASFFTTWTWSRDTMDGVAATLDIASPGLHTINLWMREDGFVADKILLTTNAGYTPSGAGPPESPR